MKRSMMVAASLALVAMSGATAASAGGADRDDPPAYGANRQDDREHPLGKQQREMRQQALAQRLNGKGSGPVHEVAKGQYVQLANEGVDQIFVMLAEYSDFNHNNIDEPDRSVDNSTIWQPDFDVAHYEDMYFNRMDAYYRRQSSGRYGVTGAVQDWVEVPGSYVDYGGGNEGALQLWSLIQDTTDAWFQSMLDQGMTSQEIADYLNSFDVQDRYDYDGDGNFDEPDGYLDHFQIVHSGEGEETGGGALGVDAIWSHRWYAFFNLIGAAGPSAYAPFGGIEIGDTDVWIGDYTMQPENGGLGVFAHEFAHDLGLPDQYDTNGGENGTAFWTIMSSGSYLGDGLEDLGDGPGGFNAWEKLQLGWLNYEVAFAGARSAHKLGPAHSNTKQAQAVFVVLPDRQRVVDIAEMQPGSTQAFYSGSGDNLDNSMTSVGMVNVPAGDPTLRAKMNFDIELDWDYGYAMASTDGTNWVNLPGALTTNDDPNGQNFGNGITGTTNGSWVDAEFDLSAFAGQDVYLAFRYWTDGAFVLSGMFVDDVSVGAFVSDAESDADIAQWAFSGFSVSNGVEEASTFNAYVAEFRNYGGDDAGLATGPYNFDSWTNQNHVEHFPYQDGVLISYWDSYYTDNNTSQHPGEGMILPIDARPDPLMTNAGTPWRSRVQMFDATFGTQPTDPVTLHYVNFGTGAEWGASTFPSQPAVREFDDTQSYWNPATSGSSVKVPGYGVTIRVRSESAQNSFAQIQVN